MSERSQSPTIAPDGKITCPNCQAEWYDCTHIKRIVNRGRTLEELEHFGPTKNTPPRKPAA